VDNQLEGFTWSADSQEIVYRSRQNRGMEWSEFEVTLESISVVEGGEDAKPKSLGSYPRSPSGSNIWLSTGHLASLQNYNRVIYLTLVHSIFTISRHLRINQVRNAYMESMKMLYVPSAHMYQRARRKRRTITS
jgi:hypothetical protein